jgi:hypothetical protein
VPNQLCLSPHVARVIADTIEVARFDFSLCSARIVSGVDSQRGEDRVFLRINFRGYNGVAKIEAEPPSSITEFWIYMPSPVTSFSKVIFSDPMQPITRAECAPDDTLDELRGVVIKPIWSSL